MIATPITIEPCSQEEIDELEVRIQARLGNQVWDLRLECQDGTLVLHGWAHTYHAKQLAEHAVLQKTCGRQVVNEIQVK